MKKHPVDDLFRRRLEGLERTPSANAWARIEEKRVSRNKSAAWIWYAAASILVGVLTGYLVLNNEQKSPVQNQVAKTEVKPAERLKESNTATEESENIASDVEKHETESNSKLEASRISSDRIAKVEPDKYAETLAAERVHEIISEHEKQIAEISEPTSHKVAKIENPDIAEVKTSFSAPDIHQPIQTAAEPTRTIVVHVETDEYEMQPKVSKFSRVFRQLKNARAGERVDWQEVGFNPKDLFAKSDDRFRNKEDKESEQDQSFKQRTNF